MSWKIYFFYALYKWRSYALIYDLFINLRKLKFYKIINQINHNSDGRCRAVGQSIDEYLLLLIKLKFYKFCRTRMCSIRGFFYAKRRQTVSSMGFTSIMDYTRKSADNIGSLHIIKLSVDTIRI